MQGQPPARLSALADRLFWRPPHLRDLVVLFRYAGDYGWFADLTRRLLPNEAEKVLGLRNINDRVRGFAEQFEAQYFPLYTPYLDFAEEGEEPTCTWLRRGVPFALMGFGYEGLHELWDFYRPGISSFALLARAPYDGYDSYDREMEGLRVSWMECAAAHIPEESLAKIPRGGVGLDTLLEALEGTRFEGAAKAAAWVWASTGNYLLDNCYEDGVYDGFSDPWDEDVIQAGVRAWREASAFIGEVDEVVKWLEGDLSTRFGEMLEFILERLPDNEQEEDDND